MPQDKWIIKNNTDRYLSVGDLPKLPALWPGKVINLLSYYEQDAISNSASLKQMLNSGWLEVTKIKNGESGKYTDADEPDDAVTTAELNNVEEDSPSNTYGSMTNDTSTTITISESNEWVESDTNWSVGYINKVSFEDSHHLVVSQSGKYEVNLSASLDSGSGDDVGIAVMVNGVAQTAGHGHATATGGNAVSVAQNVILDLSANDQISVAYVNHTNGSDIIAIHSSIVIHRLGK